MLARNSVVHPTELNGFKRKYSGPKSAERTSRATVRGVLRTDRTAHEVQHFFPHVRDIQKPSCQQHCTAAQTAAVLKCRMDHVSGRFPIGTGRTCENTAMEAAPEKSRAQQQFHFCGFTQYDCKSFQIQYKFASTINPGMV